MNRLSALAVAATFTIVLAGCTDAPVPSPAEDEPDTVALPEAPPGADALDAPAPSIPPATAAEPLPPAIHDERDVFLAAGTASGTGAECSDTRPCFDYPFTLNRTVLVSVSASRTGEVNGIAVEIRRGNDRLAFQSVSAVGSATATVAVDAVLDDGEYVLRVHAFRMVAGRFVVDATFQEPPASTLPTDTDPLVERQWGLTMSRVPEAWSLATGKNVTIAIIDTGIDLNHPDLRDKIVIVDGAVLAGTSLQASDYHGTHVAGIAAASTKNGVGIAGVAPHASILPIRVVRTSGSEEVFEEGFADRFAQAIRLAADHAQVISISVGDFTVKPQTAPEIRDALDYAWSKGAVIVSVAGNGYVVPFCGDISSHQHVLCVGAVGKDGQRAASSQMEYGTLAGTKSFVVAPGGDEIGAPDCLAQILSTVPPGGPGAICVEEHDGAWYAGMAGTSMAAPFVAGVAALLVEQGLSNEEVVRRILDTADATIGSEDALPDPNPLYGHGLVDAYCAVTNGAGDRCQ